MEGRCARTLLWRLPSAQTPPQKMTEAVGEERRRCGEGAGTVFVPQGCAECSGASARRRVRASRTEGPEGQRGWAGARGPAVWAEGPERASARTSTLLPNTRQQPPLRERLLADPGRPPAPSGPPSTATLAPLPAPRAPRRWFRSGLTSSGDMPPHLSSSPSGTSPRAG